MNSSFPDDSSDPICPYLGLPSDWQTAMDYPSLQNYCRRLRPPATPGEARQREFCLNTNHRQCNLYIGESPSDNRKSAAITTPSPAQVPTSKNNSAPVQAPMPVPIMTPASPVKPDKSARTRKRIPLLAWIIAGLLVVIGILFSFWLVFSRVLPAITTSLTKPVVSVTLPVIIQVTEAAEAEPTLAPLLVIPEDTQTVEITPAPTATTASPHVLETPFGVDRQFLLHRVSSGEDLISIVNTYKTSVEAIRAVNYNMPQELWVDTVIVIPPNQTDVTGVTPMTAYEVTSDGISIEALALEKAINPDTLAAVNDRPVDYIFQSGEWVILPITQTTP